MLIRQAHLKNVLFNFIVILYRYVVHFVFCIAILFLLRKKNLCKDWKAEKKSALAYLSMTKELYKIYIFIVQNQLVEACWFITDIGCNKFGLFFDKRY